MDEHDLHRLGLPAPGAAPTFHASSAGADAALERARHRQATRGLSVALAALALPAAVVFLLPGDSRNDSLRFARDPSPTPEQRLPEHSDAPTLETPPDAAPAPGASSAAVRPGAPAGPIVPGRPGPAPARSDSRDGQTPAAQPRQDSRPPYVERPRLAPGHDCGNVEDAGNGFHVGGGPCIRGSGPQTLRRGQRGTFVLSMCQYALEDETLVLGFRTGQEHELTVRDRVDDENGFPTDEGTQRWKWSSTVRFTQGLHQRALPPDRCFEWTTVWDGRDQNGRLLPAGRYMISQRITDSSGFGRIPTGLGITLTD